MTPLECAQTVAPIIGDLGSKFMLDPATFAKAAALDDATQQAITQGKEPVAPDAELMAGMASYAAGRFGVLGDVHSDVVIAAAAFFYPPATAEIWNQVARHVNPKAVAELYYADCASDWGRLNYTDSPELQRLCELAEKVVAQASPVCAPVFAGWRAIARPDDAPGAAELLLHILRELRFARHVVAVEASGMSPLEAVLTTGGEGNAQMFMWPEPYPDVTQLQDQRAEIEALTDELSARDFEALTETERAEFVACLTSLAAG